MNPSNNSRTTINDLVVFSPPAQVSIIGTIFFILIALSANIIIPAVTEKTLGIIVTLTVVTFLGILVFMLFRI